MTKVINIVMVPQQITDVAIEIQRHHPGLQIVLAGTTDFYDALGTIAAYVDIALDGSYDGKDIVKLCEVIMKRLINKRVTVVNTDSESRIVH